MWLGVVFSVLILLLVIDKCSSVSSPVRPFTTYNHSVELKINVADLWWTVNETQQDILFELHIKTTGWIALGISPGMYRYKIIKSLFISIFSFVISR